MNALYSIIRFFVLLLFFNLANAQSSKIVAGRIISSDGVVSGVNVINLVSEKSTLSDFQGRFSIEIKLGDVIVCSSNTIEYKRKIIEASDFNSDTLNIEVVKKAIVLNEVIVDDKSNAKGVSILPNRKTYTPAERKLRTATTGILDAPLNYISGRTKQLKKNIKIEQKERLLLKTSYLYPEKFYVETLKIPKTAIKEFQYDLIDDPDFVRALNEKKKTLLLFHAKRLALLFNQNKK